MADNQENTHPVISNQAVLSNSGVIANTSSVNNRQNVLGANSAAANATRVAQANAVAPPVVNIATMTVKEILKYVWPNKMSAVKVEPMTENKNPLVSGFGYGAWTQDSKLIYYNDGYVGTIFMPYIMRHEGIHINQFKDNKNQRPKSFFKMLEFEAGAYPNTEDWVLNKGKMVWTDPGEYETVAEEANDVSEEMRITMELYRNITAAGGILGNFSKNKHNKHYKKNLEDFIKDRINNGQPIGDDLLAQLVMIKYDGLPAIKKVNNKYMIYTVDDLYLKGESQEDKDRFFALGY